jgi:hypothetical protein
MKVVVYQRAGRGDASGLPRDDTDRAFLRNQTSRFPRDRTGNGH